MTGRVLLGTILCFFEPQGLNLQKNIPWSLLSHFRLSKHETTNEFAFIGLVKLNDEGPSFENEPILSQVRKTYEIGLI